MSSNIELNYCDYRKFNLSNTDLRKKLPDFPRGFSISIDTTKMHIGSDKDTHSVGAFIIPSLYYKPVGVNKHCELTYMYAKRMYADLFGNQLLFTPDEIILNALEAHYRTFTSESFLKDMEYEHVLNQIVYYMHNKDMHYFYNDMASPDIFQAQMVLDTLVNWYETYKGVNK